MEVDDTLLRRAREGDADALERLLREVAPLVARRCRRILPNHLDAQEAAQDAMLAVATSLAGFDGRGSFEGWVSVIAGNQARMTYRTLKRRSAEYGVDVIPDRADPRRTSVVGGTRVDLLDAIDALEERHPETVEAFVMRELGSLTYDEIAERTDARLGTVKARIHTGRAFVRERLQGSSATF